MNILVFSWRDPKHPLAGGAEQVDHEHHKGWIAAGHKVTLFTSSFPKAAKEETIDKVKVIRRGNQMIGVHVSAFLWYVFGNHDNFDLIVDEFHGIPFFTPLYVKKPILSVLQEVAREVWLKNDLHPPLNYLVGYLGYFLEPMFFIPYRKTKFMVGSQSAKKELIKMKINPKMINVIPHGIITSRAINKHRKEKTKTVAYLGALTKDKGIEEAIKAFAILRKKDKYQFWVIGKGGEDYVESLKKLCEKLKIIKDVKFWGYVDQGKKFELLSRAHVLINPSYLEGFGLVNIEANSMSTPVVSYRSPGLIDSVKHGVSGIICKKNTPIDLAKEINKILNNKTKYKKLKKGALKWSQKFDWKISRKMSLVLIERLGIK